MFFFVATVGVPRFRRVSIRTVSRSSRSSLPAAGPPRQVPPAHGRPSSGMSIFIRETRGIEHARERN